MFAKTQMPAISFSFPDVCKVTTPAGPVPTPFPNIALSTLTVPNVFNIFVMCMPVHNLMSRTVISNGNEASAPLGGVVSNQFIGSMNNLTCSTSVFYSCGPSTRMLDMSCQNGAANNMPGANLSPSQVKVVNG